jgi:hypothetical protein
MPKKSVARQSGAVCKIVSIANAQKAIGEIMRLLSEAGSVEHPQALPYRHRYNLRCAGVELAFAAAYLDNVLQDAECLGVK